MTQEETLKRIEELNVMGFEVLFFKDAFGYHCEILKNDLHVVSIFAVSIDQLSGGMNELLTEVRKML